MERKSHDDLSPVPLTLTVSRQWEDGAADILLAELHGTIPIGSLGNADVRRVSQELNAEIDALLGETPETPETSRRVCLVVDFTDASYVFGDHVGSLWLHAMRKGIQTVLVAQGESRAALTTLIAMSLPVPLVETREDGVMHCMCPHPRHPHAGTRLPQTVEGCLTLGSGSAPLQPG